MNRSFSEMANRVASNMMRGAEGERDEAMENVDQAVDTIIASLQAIDENLPKVKTTSVQEKAAVDTVQELMDEAVKPYFADAVKALAVFDN